MTKLTSIYNEGNYYLDNLVVGQSNSDACEVADDIVDCPKVRKRLVFLYGPKGSGKSHLLHTIENRVVSQSTDRKIVNMTAEQFTNEFIRGLSKKELRTFRTNCISADVFLLDNIEFIEGKEALQNMLVETLESLMHKEACIVLTSTSSAANLQDIKNDSLKEILNNANSVEIEPADFDMKVRLLEAFLKSKDIRLTERVKAVIVFVANVMNTDLREMLSVMQRIIMFASLMDKDISLELAKNIVEDNFESESEV